MNKVINSVTCWGSQRVSDTNNSTLRQQIYLAVSTSKYMGNMCAMSEQGLCFGSFLKQLKSEFS